MQHSACEVSHVGVPTPTPSSHIYFHPFPPHSPTPFFLTDQSGLSYLDKYDPPEKNSGRKSEKWSVFYNFPLHVTPPPSLRHPLSLPPPHPPLHLTHLFTSPPSSHHLLSYLFPPLSILFPLPPPPSIPSTLPPRTTDMWGLGCLIWELFNGEFHKNTALKEPEKVCGWMDGWMDGWINRWMDEVWMKR